MKIKEQYIGKVTVFLPNKTEIEITESTTEEQKELILAQKGNEFLFEEGENKETKETLTAKELIEQIEKIDNIEDLEKILDEEKAGKDRKGVIKAIETQFESIA